MSRVSFCPVSPCRWLTWKSRIMYLKWRKSSRKRSRPSRPASSIRSQLQDRDHDGVRSDGPSPSGRGQNDRTSRPPSGDGANKGEEASGRGQDDRTSRPASGIWVTRRPLVEARETGPADLLRGMGVTRTKRPWVAGDEDEDPLGRCSHGSVDAAVIRLCDYMHISAHSFIVWTFRHSKDFL